MMKNIYQIQGAYQIKQQDLRFNIYTDPSPLNYISVDGSPFQQILLQITKYKKHHYYRYLI
jgi:hypothetical protein